MANLLLRESLRKWRRASQRPFSLMERIGARPPARRVGARKRGTIEATYREEMEKREKVERSKETVRID